MHVYDSLDKFKFISVDNFSIEATPLYSVTNTVSALTELNSSADTSQLYRVVIDYGLRLNVQYKIFISINKLYMYVYCLSSLIMYMFIKLISSMM